ncbi:dTMP kinase [Buchnera aphidicola (Taiwanaphis decaspermi)]|uniref:dTMP kinase n=1 Tax=Buchnera aphidicola TaxID=9 RepID=UPI0031B85FA4
MNKLIVIEGIEGAGKSTVKRIIKNFLKSFGIKKIFCVREPGGTPIAEKLRKIIKNGEKDEKLTYISEILLIYAARSQLLKNVIKKKLKIGYWIISDRFNISSLAYQKGYSKTNDRIIDLLQKKILSNIKVGLTIYLDVLPKTALKRIKMRGKMDLIEKKSFVFFNKIRKKYLSLIKNKKNVIIINANLNIKKVMLSLIYQLKNWLIKNEYK